MMDLPAHPLLSALLVDLAGGCDAACPAAVDLLQEQGATLAEILLWYAHDPDAGWLRETHALDEAARKVLALWLAQVQPSVPSPVHPCDAGKEGATLTLRWQDVATRQVYAVDLAREVVWQRSRRRGYTQTPGALANETRDLEVLLEGPAGGNVLLPDSYTVDLRPFSSLFALCLARDDWMVYDIPASEVLPAVRRGQKRSVLSLFPEASARWEGHVLVPTRGYTAERPPSPEEIDKVQLPGEKYQRRQGEVQWLPHYEALRFPVWHTRPAPDWIPPGQANPPRYGGRNAQVRINGGPPMQVLEWSVVRGPADPDGLLEQYANPREE